MHTHQDSLEQPKSGQVTELFPYAMPFRAAQVIALLIILLCGVAAVGAVIIDWPETVNAPFVLLPETGADPIQSPFDGVLVTVEAGTQKEVEAGAVLFTIRSRHIQELVAERNTLDRDLAALVQRRDAADETHTINRGLQDAEIAQREKEVSYRKQHLAVYEDVLGRMEALNAKGLSSSVELLGHRLGYAEAQRDSALAGEQLKASKLALSRLDATHKQSLDEINMEEKRLTVQREGITSQLQDVSDDVAVVRSPCRGIILSVARKRVGDVVAVGQELCQIAQLDAPTRAHLQLEERGIALLRAGQHAKLLFEAFPYQRFGVVEGTLTWLSPTVVVSDRDQEQDNFVAVVTPVQDTIGLGNKSQALRAGMRGEARIQVGRRTLIEYAFEPLRRLRENMRDQDISR